MSRRNRCGVFHGRRLLSSLVNVMRCCKHSWCPLQCPRSVRTTETSSGIVQAEPLQHLGLLVLKGEPSLFHFLGSFVFARSSLFDFSGKHSLFKLSGKTSRVLLFKSSVTFDFSGSCLEKHECPLLGQSGKHVFFFAKGSLLESSGKKANILFGKKLILPSWAES